jgi:hypothetical protein
LFYAEIEVRTCLGEDRLGCCRRRFQPFPITGIDALWITRDESLARKRMTLAISSGLGYLGESAAGMALRLASMRRSTRQSISATSAPEPRSLL